MSGQTEDAARTFTNIVNEAWKAYRIQTQKAQRDFEALFIEARMDFMEAVAHER